MSKTSKTMNKTSTMNKKNKKMNRKNFEYHVSATFAVYSNYHPINDHYKNQKLNFHKFTVLKEFQHNRSSHLPASS